MCGLVVCSASKCDLLTTHRFTSYLKQLLYLRQVETPFRDFRCLLRQLQKAQARRIVHKTWSLSGSGSTAPGGTTHLYMSECARYVVRATAFKLRSLNRITSCLICSSLITCPVLASCSCLLAPLIVIALPTSTLKLHKFTTTLHVCHPTLQG